MKRDIILTCEYTTYNQKFFKQLHTCEMEELKEMLHPLFYEVCGLTFDRIEGTHYDEGSFKGGFIALSCNLNEEHIAGSEHMYHSDMITFLDIHKTEYNQDPDKQCIIFENEELIFSTQIYPVFLKDIVEKVTPQTSVQDLWALTMCVTPSKKALRKRLEKSSEITNVIKYR